MASNAELAAIVGDRQLPHTRHESRASKLRSMRVSKRPGRTPSFLTLPGRFGANVRADPTGAAHVCPSHGSSVRPAFSLVEEAHSRYCLRVMGDRSGQLTGE